MGICFRSRSAGRLNLIKDCPDLGGQHNVMDQSLVKGCCCSVDWFVEEGGGKGMDEEGEQKRQNDT